MPQNTATEPTADQIRAARHRGFNDSIGYMPQERKERIAKSHQTQDARRENNVSGFYKKMRGEA